MFSVMNLQKLLSYKKQKDLRCFIELFSDITKIFIEYIMLFFFNNEL